MSNQNRCDGGGRYSRIQNTNKKDFPQSTVKDSFNDGKGDINKEIDGKKKNHKKENNEIKELEETINNNKEEINNKNKRSKESITNNKEEIKKKNNEMKEKIKNNKEEIKTKKKELKN